MLGMAYIQTRQPDAARQAWARAFRLPPDSPAARLLTAQMMVRAEMDEMAQAELTAALEKDPRLPQAHFLLGQTALFRGRLDEAIALFRKELEVSPGNAMAFYRAGRRATRASAAGTTRSTRCSGRSGSTRTSAAPTSSWARPTRPRATARRRRACCGARSATTPTTRPRTTCSRQLLQQLGRAEEARKEFEIAERLQSTVER